MAKVRELAAGLEGHMSFIEDSCLLKQLSEIIEPTGSAAPLLSNWQKFRGFLLHAQRATRLPDELLVREASILQSLCEIISWVVSSRRVFQLSVEMQSFLERIEFGNMQFSDIFWPFPSFMVELGTPLLSSGGSTFRSVLVSSPCVIESPLRASVAGSMQGPVASINEIKFIHPIRAGIEEYRAWDLKRRQNALRLARAGNFEKTVSNIEEIAVRLGRAIGGERGAAVSGSIFNGTSTEHVSDIERQMLSDGFHVASRATRIVVNLCLFLSNLESASRGETERWEKNAKYPIHSVRCVTDGANICIIDASHLLQGMSDPDDKTEEGCTKASWTVTPHWRRAYKRRRRGMGNDPTAPRDQKVRHTIVNGHLLKDGQLPIAIRSNLV